MKKLLFRSLIMWVLLAPFCAFAESYDTHFSSVECICSIYETRAMLTPTTNGTPLGSTLVIDGNDPSYQGVGIFYLQGDFTRIEFTNLQGTKQCPIIITTHGTTATFSGYPTGLPVSNENTFELFDSNHVIIDGSNGQDKFGIIINDAPLGRQAMIIQDQDNPFILTSNIEVHHVEISNLTGSSGLVIKNNPDYGIDCHSLSASGETYNIHNITIHDNYIHHVTHEGMYIGDTKFLGVGYAERYPQPVTNVTIFDNTVTNTGWDAIQLSAATSGSRVYNNICTNYGESDYSGQANGIQLGLGTQRALCYNNIIEQHNNGIRGNGIICQGAGRNCVYNNIIINANENGIYVNESVTFEPGNNCTGLINETPSGSQFLHNTIVNSKHNAFKVSGQHHLTGQLIQNNLMIFDREPASYMDVVHTNNGGLLACSSDVQNMNLALYNIEDYSDVLYVHGYSPYIYTSPFVPLNFSPLLNAMQATTNTASCTAVTAYNMSKDYYGTPRGVNSYFGAVEATLSSSTTTTEGDTSFLNAQYATKLSLETAEDFQFTASVSPNPFFDGATLSINMNNALKGNYQLAIIDLNGQVVFKDNIDSTASRHMVYTLPLRVFTATGVYFLQLTDPKGEREVQRLMKM